MEVGKHRRSHILFKTLSQMTFFSRLYPIKDPISPVVLRLATELTLTFQQGQRPLSQIRAGLGEIFKENIFVLKTFKKYCFILCV